MSKVLDEMIASLEATPPAVTEVPLPQDLLDNLSSCDFCGGGCSDPECWRCYSPLSPDNLRMLAENLATAGKLSRAWQRHIDDPTWYPGCALVSAREVKP